jgi:glycosyltransferase involved in cell wall biosynthesis
MVAQFLIISQQWLGVVIFRTSIKRNLKMANKYVLITPARNEEAFIERTIQSVISQTILPEVWVIVSDGSTDRTDKIVKSHMKKYKFISFVRRDGDDLRNFGSQVRAFNAGFRKLNGLEYDFIGNLDADVSFQSDYYEAILKKFSDCPRLGLAGGFIFEESNGKFGSRRYNRTYSVAHAVQLFRRSCFEDIGGYVPLRYGGSDSYAEATARFKGWNVKAFPELPVYHHKPTLTAEGMLMGGLRQGKMDYDLGSSIIFELLKCIARTKVKPYGIYAGYRFAGFISGYFAKEKRGVPKEFIMELRSEQYSKIMNIFSNWENINHG